MLNKILATSAIAVLTGLPAVAGSLEPPVVEMPPPAVVEPDTDWSGFYAGVHGGAAIDVPIFAEVGAHAKYLGDMGDFVVGAEANYTYVIGANAHVVGVEAIAGFDAGTVMPHVTAGGAWDSVLGGLGWTVGAGVSVMATDDIMLTGRYRYRSHPGSSMGDIMAGASFKF